MTAPPESGMTSPSGSTSSSIEMVTIVSFSNTRNCLTREDITAPLDAALRWLSMGVPLLALAMLLLRL